MHDTPRPHDLLWGMTPAQLQADAPAWAHEVLIAGQPVVVRRAMVENGQLAVGLRGSSRDQRYASVMPARSVLRKVRPEQLVERLPVSDLPALHALKQLRPNMDALGLCWGVTGSVGFQLATGLPTAHTDSDLDLLLRTPIELPRHKARTLLGLLDEAACRVDLQLETPSGAIAMREWAGSASRVLLKCVTGARLVENPWDQAEMVA